MSMGGGGSGPSNTTTTTKVQLPKYAQQAGQTYLTGLENTLMPGGQLQPYPYPSQQIYGLTPDQVAGMNMGTSVASMGTPAADTGLNLMQGIMSSDYLSPNTNPYLSGMENAAAQQLTNQYTYATAPQIQAQAAMDNNFGSSANASAQDQAQFGLGQNLANLANTFYGQQFQNQESNQLKAATQVPSLMSAQYLPSQELQTIGGAQQQFGQNVYNTAYQNQYNATNWPFTALNMLGSAITPAVGGAYTSSTSQPNPYSYGPSTSSILGGLGALGGGLGMYAAGAPASMIGLGSQGGLLAGALMGLL